MTLSAQAPEHAMHQRWQVEPEQRLGAQHRHSPRPLAENAGLDDAGVHEARQQQRIGPHQDAGRHAGERAARGGAPPDQAAEERRRELRDRGEGQQPDGGELRVTGQAVVQVGEEQDDEDCSAPDVQQHPASVAAAGEQRLAPLQHQRHDDVVRHHDGERDRLDDHHRGRGRQPADERRDGQQVVAGRQRQREHEHVAVELPGREGQHAGERDRHHEQVDQHQVERKQPGRPPDLGLAVVLHHGDVKLARQQHDGEQRQHRHRDQRAEQRLAGQHRGGIRTFERAGEQRERAVEQPERHENADRHERDELDQRFGRDRQHQSVLVLGGVDVPGSEQHCEQRHRDRDVEGDVAEHRLHRAARRSDVNQDRGQRGRHRFELQRDVRDGADDGDQRDGRGHRLRLAVAGGDEVGDRGDVLRLGQAHDTHDERRAQADHQNGAEIDGQELEAGARREADRAEEGPRRAVDRQRQRIDQMAQAAFAAEVPRLVAIARDHEQQSEVAERTGDDDPALQHAPCPRDPEVVPPQLSRVSLSQTACKASPPRSRADRGQYRGSAPGFGHRRIPAMRIGRARHLTSCRPRGIDPDQPRAACVARLAHRAGTPTSGTDRCSLLLQSSATCGGPPRPC